MTDRKNEIKPKWPKDKHVLTKQDEIENVFMHKPHTFILGAGASLAACPNGDSVGRKLPLMNNVVEIIGLEELLGDHGVTYKGENFEAIFGSLYNDPSQKELISELENAVDVYFEGLELPNEPTIYDYLVLSLREKDIISTFNWDPFLSQAISRNGKFVKMPGIFFLHGNVFLGHCPEHFRKGHPLAKCPECQKPFQPSQLLFPIEQKDYNADPHIKNEWDSTCDLIKGSNFLTVFGYGAPKSDVEAVELLKSAWHENKAKEFLQTEVIDIKTEQELEKTWEELWFSHHYDVQHDFFTSWVANHPRRSCEAIYSQTIEAMFIDTNPVPQNVSFDELYKWFEPLIEAEEKAKTDN